MLAPWTHSIPSESRQSQHTQTLFPVPLILDSDDSSIIYTTLSRPIENISDCRLQLPIIPNIEKQLSQKLQQSTSNRNQSCPYPKNQVFSISNITHQRQHHSSSDQRAGSHPSFILPFLLLKVCSSPKCILQSVHINSHSISWPPAMPHRC